MESTSMEETPRLFGVEGSGEEAPAGGDASPSPLAPRGRQGRAKRVVAATAAVTALVGGGYGIRAFTGSNGSATTTSSSNSATTVSVRQTGDVSALVQRAEKAVVEITSSGQPSSARRRGRPS